MSRVIKRVYYGPINMPKDYKYNMIVHITDSSKVELDELVQYCLSKYAIYFKRMKIPEKLIRARILKDINPSFKRKCQSIGIAYNSELKIFKVVE